MSNSWSSYPSIYNLGHKAVEALFTVPCYVEEKIDGSQFSFGVFHPSDRPEWEVFHTPGLLGNPVVLCCKSKGAPIYWQNPPTMFRAAVEAVVKRVPLLMPGFTYRGEVLCKPKHNTLAYNRVPQDNFILFDVSIGDQDFLSPKDKQKAAQVIGFECVPMLHHAATVGENITLEGIRALLARESVLGGQKIEGVVIKQVEPLLFGLDKKLILGKFVSEHFREIHKTAWADSNPNQVQFFLEKLAKSVCTPARWDKAIQHLAEAGTLEHSPRDIGQLMKEIPDDVIKECKDEIEVRLWEHFWPQLRRMLTSGFPEYYKQRLMEDQFNAAPDA